MARTWPTTETHEAEAAELTGQLLEPKYNGCDNLTGDGTVRPAHLGRAGGLVCALAGGARSTLDTYDGNSAIERQPLLCAHSAQR